MDLYKDEGHSWNSEFTSHSTSHNLLSNDSPSKTPWSNEFSAQDSPSQKPRKRKLDKDGFVVPNTPDRYHRDQYEDDSPFSTQSTGFEPAEKFQSFIQNQSNETGDSEFTGFTYGQPDNMAQPANEEGLPFEDGAASQDTGAHMQKLLEDFKMESMSVFEEWSKVLCESEEFEIKCPQKLDAMIEKAKVIEQSLGERKEIFKQRLSMVDNTLQVM